MHTDTRHTDRFSAAAASGFRPIPLKSESKVPMVEWKEFQDRDPSEEELLAWDKLNANIAYVTGTPLPDGLNKLIVLDVDSPEAEEAVQSLSLPITPTVSTSKGRHLYLKLPLGVGASNRVRVGGIPLDVRADGGYVVAPSSIHPDGTIYDWAVSPDEADFADFPVDLLAYPSRLSVAKKAPITSSLRCVSPPGVDRALETLLGDALDSLRSVTEGSRNDQLFQIAASMAGHVAAAGANWAPVAYALAEVSAAIGLEDAEINSTLRSAWERGSKNPTLWLQIASNYVYVAAQNRFMHLSSMEKLEPAGFNGLHGRVHGGKALFSNFLLDNGFVAKVQDLTYDPRERAGFITMEGLSYYNTYVPSGIVPEEGDAAPFEDFVKYLFPDPEARQHILRTMAFTVRNPGQKLRHAIMLRSRVQGVGKSILAKIWSLLMGEANTRLTSPEEVHGNFNAWQTNCTLCLCEELNLGFGLQAYNRLKNSITGDNANVNEKYVAVRDCRVFATFVFLTNLARPMLIEDTDRRVFFYDIPAERRTDGFYQMFAEWFASNMAVIRWYLEQVDLSDFNPHAPPPETEAKRGLIADSKGELARDIAYLIGERAELKTDIVTIDKVDLALGRSTRNRSARVIADALKENGAVKLGQVSVQGHRVVLWAIRRTEIWEAMPSREWAEELVADRGLFADYDDKGVLVLPARLMPKYANQVDLRFDPETGTIIGPVWFEFTFR